MNLRSKHKLINTQGSSIVIALVFFLICAVIGSVVLTAASINAKAVATHQDTQQADYTVSSAAQTIASQLEGVSLVVDYAKNENGIPGYALSKNGVAVAEGALVSLVWKSNFEEIWNGRKTSGYTIGSTATPLTITTSFGEKADNFATVYLALTYDKDWNISAKFTTNNTADSVAAYDETLFLASVPTFDNKGKLLRCDWPASEIQKTEGGGL